MPSYQENFGMSAAEAMAAARPVIVSTGVNIAPKIQAARAGLVVDQTAEAFADGISRLVRDPARCRSLGLNGRRLVREQFTLEAAAEAMVETYERVLAG